MSGVHDDLVTLRRAGWLSPDESAALDRAEAELSRLREQRDSARMGCAFGCGPYPEDSIHVGAGIGLVPACPIHGWVAPMLDARDDAIKAAEARCERLQQALGNLLTYAQLDDPWGEGVQRRERYLRLLTEAREALAGLDTPAERVTHGRHCPCSACAREDWTRITGPCGMHGADCPAVYAPLDTPADRHEART